MPGRVVLEIVDLRIRYGKLTAVDGLTLSVSAGEMVALLGPNGSGKSSTLAAAAGIIESVDGQVAVNGLSRRVNPNAYARQVGFVPQTSALFDELTARDNLMFFGRLYGYRDADLRPRVERVLESLNLSQWAEKKVSCLSGGVRQRLNLAAALLHEPILLLLDEPTAALDPASRELLFARLDQLREDGHAILLTTHHLDEAEHYCDRVLMLERGRVRWTKQLTDGWPGCSEPIEPNTGFPAPVANTLVADLLHPIAKVRQREIRGALRQRFGEQAQVQLSADRLRIQVAQAELLGPALALLLAQGVLLRACSAGATSTRRLPHLARSSSSPEATCDLPSG